MLAHHNQTEINKTMIKQTCIVSAVHDGSHGETQRDAEFSTRCSTTSCSDIEAIKIQNTLQQTRKTPENYLPQRLTKDERDFGGFAFVKRDSPLLDMFVPEWVKTREQRSKKSRVARLGYVLTLIKISITKKQIYVYNILLKCKCTKN